MKRVGIFLGTFNPPHIGHISVVSACVNEYIKKQNLLDSIWVIPAYQNPNKSNTNNYRERLFFCEQSNGGFGYIPNVFVKDIEGDLKPKNTIELIEYLKSNYTDTEFVWLITWETYCELLDGKWFASSQLLDENKFIIINEGKWDLDLSMDYIHSRIGQSNLIRCKNVISTMKLPNRIDISSTKIREMIKNGECPIPYITCNIWETLIIDYTEVNSYTPIDIPIFKIGMKVRNKQTGYMNTIKQITTNYYMFNNGEYVFDIEDGFPIRKQNEWEEI